MPVLDWDCRELYVPASVIGSFDGCELHEEGLDSEI